MRLILGAIMAVAVAGCSESAVSEAESAAPGEAGAITFAIGSADLSMDAPEGYCLPEGEFAALAEQTAAIDPQNDTLVSLVACNRTDGTEPWEDYILIKTPKAMRNTSVGLDEFLREMEQAAQQGAFGDLPTSLDIDEMELQIDARAFGYAGTDDRCTYLSGTMTAQAAESTADALAATCMTVADSRMISVNVYDYRTQNRSTVAQMRAFARQVAESVH